MSPIQQLIQLLSENNLWEKEITLERNQYLKTAGTIDTNIYFVDSGSLRIFISDESEEQTIRFGYVGSLIASLDSYISNQPSDMYIQALKKSKVKSTSKSKFTALINSDDSNLRLWLSIVEQLVFTQLERERDILTSSPNERYRRVLSRSPQLFQEIPHKYIASYLRMSPETLSRLKKS